MTRRISLAVALAFTTVVTFAVIAVGGQAGFFSGGKPSKAAATVEQQPETVRLGRAGSGTGGACSGIGRTGGDHELRVHPEYARRRRAGRCTAGRDKPRAGHVHGRRSRHPADGARSDPNGRPIADDGARANRNGGAADDRGASSTARRDRVRRHGDGDKWGPGDLLAWEHEDDNQSNQPGRALRRGISARTCGADLERICRDGSSSRRLT